MSTTLQRHLLAAMTAMILFVNHASAVSIRDDVPASEYIALGADPRYEATGAWFVNTAQECNATVIGPSWIVTAGHCGGNRFGLGADINNLTADRSIISTVRHPNFNTTSAANGPDLRVAELDSPILDVTPARLYRTVGFERDRDAVFIGYGHTGSGDVGFSFANPRGTRYGAQNTIDRFGGQIGLTPDSFAFDFDNPSTTSDNAFGSSDPLPLEGLITARDSGGGWYVEENGVTYLIGVTSFLSAADGNANADYGDIGGAARIGRQLDFFDNNANVALHWNQASGDWASVSGWDLVGAAPDAARTAVIGNGIATIDAPANAEYTFVDWNGRLELDDQLSTDRLLLKRTGVLAVGVGSAGQKTLDGDLIQTEGNLHITLHGSGANSGLNVTGLAQLDGNLGIEYGSGYDGPANRGEVDSHVVLSAASIVGEFDSIDGAAISGDDFEYVGENGDGEDGLFRKVTTSGGNVSVTTYFAISGDGNGDGVVDASDFNIWNSNKFQVGTDWSTGDFNGDNITDASDFNLWNTNKFTGVNLPIPPGNLVVPEPSGMALLLVGVFAVSLKRRRASTR